MVHKDMKEIYAYGDPSVKSHNLQPSEYFGNLLVSFDRVMLMACFFYVNICCLYCLLVSLAVPVHGTCGGHATAS